MALRTIKEKNAKRATSAIIWIMTERVCLSFQILEITLRCSTEATAGCIAGLLMHFYPVGFGREEMALLNNHPTQGTSIVLIFHHTA